jgi:hypothetical protein
MKRIKKPDRIPAELIDMAICRFLWHSGDCEAVGCSNCEYDAVGCKEIEELKHLYYEKMLDQDDTE